jgi:hypothetical protein
MNNITFLFTFFVLYTFPLNEIMIGSMYFEYNVCGSFLNIGLWLIIKGFINIFLFIILTE